MNVREMHAALQEEIDAGRGEEPVFIRNGPEDTLVAGGGILGMVGKGYLGRIVRIPPQFTVESARALLEKECRDDYIVFYYDYMTLDGGFTIEQLEAILFLARSGERGAL